MPEKIYGKAGMRRFCSLPLLLVGSARLAACGTGTPSPVVSTSGPEPAGQAAADWAGVETVSLMLSDFHFRPDQLELQQGRPYRLHLVNASTSAHTFSSAPFFKAIVIRRPVPGTGAGIAITSGEIAVGPGEQKDLDFVAVTPGSYAFVCSKFLHSTLGMAGNIVVH